MVVDLVLTGMTTYQCLRVQRLSRGLQGGGTTGLTSAILQQSLQYYLLITLCNIGNWSVGFHRRESLHKLTLLHAAAIFCLRSIWYATQDSLNSLVGPLALNVTELMALHLCLAFKSDVYLETYPSNDGGLQKKRDHLTGSSCDDKSGMESREHGSYEMHDLS